MKTLAIRLLLPILFTGLASADLIITNVPLAGYTTDAAGSWLRPVWGVPGGFSFGDPISLPDGVSQIRLAPRQEYALATVGTDGTVVLSLKSGGISRVIPIPGAMASPDWIAFSTGAQSALLFQASTQRLQLVKGLPNAPKVAADLDTSILPAPPVMAAVSDDGSLVLAAAGTAVYRLAPDGTAGVVLSAAGIQALTVLPNGSDAAIADSCTGAIYVVHDAAGKPQAQTLASGFDSVGAMFPSVDGQTLFVAQPGASSVSAVNVFSGEVRTYASFEAPNGLAPLRNGDTFLISAKAGEPGWIFYQDGSAGRVVFIPAIDDSSSR